MSSEEGAESTDEYARRNQGRWTLREIGNRLQLHPKTIARKIRGKSASSGKLAPNQERSLEAGLAWHALTGQLPTSYKWNVSLCLGSTPENYARCLRGWAYSSDKMRARMPVEKWPSPQSIANDFGSFPEFCEVLMTEIRSRTASGQVYQLAPIPEEQVTNAELQAAYVRDLEPEDPDFVNARKGVHRRFRGDHPDLSIDVVVDALRPALGSNRGVPFHAMKVMDARKSMAIVGNAGETREKNLARLVSADLMEAVGPIVLIESPRKEISRLLHEQFEVVEILVAKDGELFEVDLREPEPHRVAVLRSDDPARRNAVIQAFESSSEAYEAAGLFVSCAESNLPDLILLVDALEDRDFVTITYSWEPTEDWDSFDGMTSANILVVGRLDEDDAYWVTEAAKTWLDQTGSANDRLLTVGVMTAPDADPLEDLSSSTDLTTRDVDPGSIPYGKGRPMMNFEVPPTS